MFLVPPLSGVSVHDPVPLASVIVQVAPAPSSTATEPVGVPKDDVTLTDTTTPVPIGAEFGAWPVMVVVVASAENVCGSVPELVAKFVEPP